MKIIHDVILVLMLLSVSVSSVSEDTSAIDQGAPKKESLSDQVNAIDDTVDPKIWKIRKGCITMRRVKRIRFVDDQTALVSMRGKKTAVLRLQRACPGIKKSGFIRYNAGPRLCAKFDRLAVMGSGYSCRIASIEPFIELEEPVPEKNDD